MHFPLTDVVGSAGASLTAGDQAFLGEQVTARAREFERDGVPRDLLLSLGQRGLFGANQDREIAELLAGCSGDTWFCWAQHASPMRALEAGDGPGADQLRGNWLDALQHGRAIAAVAFAHLRRPGVPNPQADRVPGGWRVNGTLDWITSWDIADVVLVMARSGNDIVQFLMPKAEVIPTGFEVGPVLDLVAMRGTHTRPARLRDVFIPDGWIVGLVSFDDWQARDAVKTRETNPATFGIVRSAIAELDAVAQERDDALIGELVTALTDQCRELRASTYAETPAAPLRARALHLAVRASTAVVTARAGAAMRTGCAAERRVRAALFMQVQAQTVVTRDASLRLTLNEP